jgi:hypothetical protein
MRSTPSDTEPAGQQLAEQVANQITTWIEALLRTRPFRDPRRLGYRRGRCFLDRPDNPLIVV